MLKGRMIPLLALALCGANGRDNEDEEAEA